MYRKLVRGVAGIAAALAVAAPPAPAAQIIGGQEAAAIPSWMADLRSDGGHSCGGTLIRPEWVLTAAHCISGAKATDFTVAFGRLRQSDTSSGIELAVEELIVPDESSSGLSFDVGLMRLAAPVPGAPLAVAAAGQETLWAPGQPATVIGWGMDESGGSPDHLRELHLPMAADDECAQQYSLTIGFDPETDVCAGDLTPGRSPCYGDSGGPLFVRDAQGGPLLVGVVSRGLACGIVPTYSVYARVGGPTLRAWLEANLPKQAVAAPAPAPPGQPAPAEPSRPAAEPPGAGLRLPRARSCRRRLLTTRIDLPAGRGGTIVVRFGRRTVLRRAIAPGTRRVVVRGAPARAFRATATLRVDGALVTGSRRYPSCR